VRGGNCKTDREFLTEDVLYERLERLCERPGNFQICLKLRCPSSLIGIIGEVGLYGDGGYENNKEKKNQTPLNARALLFLPFSQCLFPVFRLSGRHRVSRSFQKSLPLYGKNQLKFSIY